MNGARFEDLLERTMGLKAVSIGASAIRRAVALRMSASNLADEECYWQLLQASRGELQELIEAVIVPETWFFRDPEAFAAMARLASARDPKASAQRPLRLLSLPCSTGEEAYTMAMALLDLGLPADCFRIDAVDISARSLALAHLGVYGRNSFRSQDMGFRDRHFEAAERGYRIGETARAPVRFIHGNMLDPDFLIAAEPYDFIFCRNLLIYFGGPTQSRAIGVLKRLLALKGVLFAGHSETGLMAAHGFVSTKIPMAFAFRPARGGSSTPGIRKAPASRARQTQLTRPMPARPLPIAACRSDAARVPTRSSIEDLRRVADAGRLEEAARGCEEHIRESGPSAPALLLLALISDALGDSLGASNYYRKALYLEPDNVEALGHLALLLRKHGDQAGARLLDERMHRHAERRAG